MKIKNAILLTLFFAAGVLLFFNFNQTYYTIAHNVKEEKLIYGAVLTAAAAILAITFTISQHTIGQIAKDYSPYLVEYYYKIDKMGGFIGFVITIILSAAGLSITTPLNLREHQSFIEITLMFFLGSLVLYVGTFFDLINIINPLKFSKYIFQFTRREIEKEGKDAENLIISMGNTTRKFIDDKESRIAMDFLDEFQNLSVLFLTQKEQHDTDENKTNKEFYDVLRKSPIMQITDQLQKIYKYSYENEDFEVSTRTISVIEAILRKAMEYEDNDDIIRLFTSRGYGYVLYNLLEITLNDKKERSEKLILASSLFKLPLNFLRSDKVVFRYLDYLAPEHIIYMVKKIIDQNDFIFFTDFVRESTLAQMDVEPSEIAEEILWDLLEYRQYPQLAKYTYELEFIIKIQCALNYTNISKFMEKLGSYKKLLIETGLVSSDMIDTRIKELEVKALRYYVNSLTYTAIFWIGAYLIYKGKDYGAYLHKLWNISNPEEDPTTYLNRPPVSTDLTWSVLQVLGQGGFTSTPEFGDFQSAEPFFYKYLGMIFLKSDKLFSFPSPMDLKSLVEKDEEDILSKWMGICHSLKSDTFLKNTKNLSEKVDLGKFFNYDNVSDVLKNRINRMQEDAEKCEKTIERLRPMDQNLVNAAIKLALDSYKKHSRIDSISTVNLTKDTSQEFYSIAPRFALPRSAFQEIAGVSQFLDSFFEGIAMDIARNETGMIFDRISKTTKIHKRTTKIEDLHIDLEDQYKKMKASNHEPDLIFIPFSLLAEFQKQAHSGYAHHITLDGKVLETVHHNNLENEIILACKKSIKITCLETDQGRLEVTITEDPTDTQNAIITYLMASKVDILDTEGFSKITVFGVERSRFYHKTKTNKK